MCDSESNMLLSLNPGPRRSDSAWSPSTQSTPTSTSTSTATSCRLQPSGLHHPMPACNPAESPSPLSSSVELTNYRILPEEILRMTESETACQYCGVSYLILSKYEKMKVFVDSLERELQDLKSFAAERPTLMEKLATLEKKVSDQAVESLERNMELGRANRSLELSRAELEEYRSQCHDLSMQLESLQRRQRELESAQSSKSAVMLKSLASFHKDIMEQRHALAMAKDEIEMRLSTFMRSSLKNQLDTIIQRVSMYWKSRAEESLRRLEDAKNGEIEHIQKTIGSLRDEARYWDDENKRLSTELRELSDKYNESLGSQKSYIQGLQTSCLKLEQRLGVANGHIACLSQERDKLSDTHATLTEQNKSLKEELLRSTQVLEKRVVTLEGHLKEKENELSDVMDKWRSERRSAETGTSALSKAQRALDTKDEKIVQLEQNIRELNAIISNVRVDRQKTIEAHQSRVQHLQEKFLQDIQKAGKLEGERVEAELRQRFAIDRDEALRELKQKMHQEASQTQDRLVHQIDSLKLSVERSNIELQRKCQNIEEEWARKYGSLAEQLQAQRTSHAAEMQELQYKLTEASERVPTLSSVAEDEFRTQLAKRDAEIAFLKNTVRIECEERMELIAAVDTLKKKFNGIIVPGTEGLQANLRTGPHQRLPAIDGSSPRPDPAETIGPSRSMPELGAVHPALSASSPSPPAFPRPELPLPPQPSQPPQSKSDSERLFERKAHVASVKKLAKMAKLPKK